MPSLLSGVWPIERVIASGSQGAICPDVRMLFFLGTMQLCSSMAVSGIGMKGVAERLTQLRTSSSGGKSLQPTSPVTRPISRTSLLWVGARW